MLTIARHFRALVYLSHVLQETATLAVVVWRWRSGLDVRLHMEQSKKVRLSVLTQEPRGHPETMWFVHTRMHFCTTEESFRR